MNSTFFWNVGHRGFVSTGVSAEYMSNIFRVERIYGRGAALEFG
jgi:hypothetical protein